VQDEQVRDLHERPFESVEPSHGVPRVCHTFPIGPASPEFPNT
jgi:hypothetical protein